VRLTTPHPQEKAHGPPSLLSQMLTALAEKPPASAGYRGSDLVLWRTAAVDRTSALGRKPKFKLRHDLALP
jgi:hypothetical protein